ncbi:MAG: amidohydrolase family protein [Acidimicrobiales bacterium]|jgi:imidazolonepropionase-like amidohydrolase
MTPAPRLLVTADRLLIGPDEAVDGGGILLSGGRVLWAGPLGRLPDDAAPAALERHNGACIVPGLIDAHVHLAFRFGADLTLRLSEHDVAVLAAPARDVCGRLVAAGVTTVRDLGSPGRLVHEIRDAVERGNLMGPRIVSSGPPLTSPAGHLAAFGVEIEDDRDAAAAVRQIAALGADVVKVIATGGALTPGTALGRAQLSTSAISAAVAAAARLGLLVAVHAHGTEGIARAVEAGAHSIEHCSWMNAGGEVAAPEAALVQQMAERHQVAVIAGPLPEDLVARPRHDPSMAGRRLLAIWDNAKSLAERGVVLALGSDAIFGQFDDAHDLAWRAQCMVELGGFEPVQVLRAIWAGGAAALGLVGEIGRLAAGARADIAVLEGDPRHDISALHRLRAVYVAGTRLA